jgi:hypothetical protein
MAKPLTEVTLPSGKTLEVRTRAAGGGVGPASGGKAGQAIDLAGDVMPAIEELAGTLVERLANLARGPESVAVELGVTLGGKTGIILAEGSAEANIKLTLTWTRPSDPSGPSDPKDDTAADPPAGPAATT